jgi:Arm DNA-binding domain/Phage integrase central domain
MPTIKLTQSAAERLAPPKTGRIDYFDKQLPAFGLRISSQGHKAWQVFYRIGGKQRRYTFETLAKCPSVSEARERAREILREVGRGIDPAAEKPSPARPPDTIASLVAQHIARYARPKNKSWQETHRTLQRHVVSRWGARAADAITRRDVLELLDELVDRGNPIAANRVLAAIRTMFAWAVERDILTTTPVVNIKAPPSFLINHA